MKALVMYGLKERDNPYMRLLIGALVASGVDVVGPRGGRFNLWNSARANWRPDVVHLQWQHGFFTGNTPWNALRRSVQFMVQILGLRVMRIPVVWTVHNLVNHESRQARWELLMCRVLAKSVSALIVHCDEAAKVVAAAYRISPRRIRVVPHGHYSGVYHSPIAKAKARRALGLGPEETVFLFFGQIRPYKGVGELVRAFATLEQPGLRLVLAGEPKFGEEDHLCKDIKRDPRILARLEFIPDDELIRYICASDLVVLPYRSSLTSGAAILAASYGRAIVAPELGCMREFPADAAVLYDPEACEGLASALHLACERPLNEMGEAARVFVEQFPWPAVGARTMAVYKEVAGHG